MPHSQSDVPASSKQQDGTLEFQESAHPVTVCGVFQTPSFTFHFGAKAILLPVDLLATLPGVRLQAQFQQRQRGVQGYAEVMVRTDSPSRVRMVEQEIRAMGFECEALLDNLEDAQKFFVFLDLLFAAVGTVALVVAGLGILNTQLIAVLERTREIGLFKSLGASDGDIRTLFLAEALLVGTVGGTCGLALAAVVCRLLAWAINAYGRQQGIPENFFTFSYPWWLLFGSVIFSGILSVLSAVYPAGRAARIDPIAALRSE